MRSMIASLRTAVRHMAAQDPRRSLIATLLRVAIVSEDLNARCAYIEGLLGRAEKSLSRNPFKELDAARKALASTPDGLTGNEIVDALKARGMSNGDVMKMLSEQNQGLAEAVTWGARDIFGRRQAVRGITPEGITQALTVGISPLTYERLSKYKGHGLFYWLGESYSGSGLKLAGIKKVARESGKRMALDISRKKKDDQYQQSMDAPTGETGRTLSETLPDVGDSEYGAIADAVFSDPRLRELLDQAVRRSLQPGPQTEVWEAVLSRPDLLDFSRSSLGVQGKEFAPIVYDLAGREYKGISSAKSVGTIFRKKVRPAIMDAMSDPRFEKAILRRRDLLDSFSGARWASKGPSAFRVAARYAALQDRR